MNQHLDTNFIKSLIDIVDLISKDEPLQKHGDTYRSGHLTAGHGSQSGTCLDVCPKKQVYLCRSCGESGDIFSWVMHRDNGSFLDAAKWLCETYRIPLPNLSAEDAARWEANRKEREHIRSIIKEAFHFYHDQMTDERGYFRSRGISDEMIDFLLLGYAPKGNALVKHFFGKYSTSDLLKTGLFFKVEDSRNGGEGELTSRYIDRYVFPYWKGGEIVFSIGRSIDPSIEAHKKYVKHLTYKAESWNYVSSVAVDHCIWGIDSIRGAKEMIITEGVVDAILALQAGFAVLSPLTTQFSNHDIERLIQLTKHAETVYLINDNETSGAGIKGAKKTAEELFKDGRDVRMVTLPRPSYVDKVDLADFLVAYGGDGLRSLIKESPDFIEYHIKEIASQPAGRKRIHDTKAVLRLIATAEPLVQERYLSAMVEAEIGKASTLLEQMKREKRDEKDINREKTAIQLADELIAERYTDKNGNRTLVFHHDSWFEYDGTRYVERSKSEYEAEIITKIRREVGVDVSQHLVTSVRLATYPLVILPNTVEQPCVLSSQESTEHLISLKNGLMDLNRLIHGEPNPLTPHTPDFFVLSSHPYDYDPYAQCPRWLRFLDDALSIDPDLIWIMQEFYGLCLTHDTRWHNFLFLQGESRTGKGVAFEVLQALVGLDNVANVPLRQFGDTFGLQPLIGKKLNINAEVPELDAVAEDILKEYCGGATTITINRKNKEAISTRQRARLAFSSNHLPNFRDRSEGLWTRMLMIPFNRVVPEAERDPNLADDLIENELPGIFNWAMEGYKRLVKNKGFTDSATMRMTRDDYRDETTPVRRFLREYTVVAEGAETSSKALYDLYILWAKLEGHARQSHVTFGRDATAYFRSIPQVERSHDTKRNKFVGVQISPEGRQEILERAAERTDRSDRY